MRKSAVERSDGAPTPPELSRPSLRSWLEGLPVGHGRSAVFDTRIGWSPSFGTGKVKDELAKRGYRPLVKPHKFIVTGTYGPLREGQLELARAWGSELAEAMARV